MRYELPQFINIEDKIFGPFTFKQFVYLAGGGGGSYVIWRLLPPIIAIIIILPIIALALALAFYKVNGRPFIDVLQASVTHAFRSKFYLWQQKNRTGELPKTPEIKNLNQQITAPIGDSRLRKIAWNLDILDMDDPNANRDRKN